MFTINRPDVLTYIDANLTPNTHYYYRVEAFNIAGDSNFSNVANAITPLPAAKAAIAQQPASAVAGVAMCAVVVDLETVKGQIAATENSAVTLSIAAGPAGATLGGTVTVQAVNGVAVFNDLSLSVAGKYTLVATDSNLVAAVTHAFTVAANSATARLVLLQSPTTSVVGRNVAPVPIVALEDAFGNLITTRAGRVFVAIAAGMGGAVLKGSTSATFSRGIARFHNFQLTEAGSYTLRLSDPAANAAVTDVTVTIVAGSTFIPVPRTVNLRAGKSVVVSVQLASSAAGGIPFGGAADVVDENGSVLGSGVVSSRGAVRVVLSGLAAGTILRGLRIAGTGIMRRGYRDFLGL